MNLADRLGDVLAAVTSVDIEDDGSLTVRHDGTVASVRVVAMVSLTQVLAWDLSCDAELRRNVAALAHTTTLGTITLAEQAGGIADVMLRYNFPAGGLDERALQTLMLMVLDGGVAARRVLV
jgi:hypothetical protein